jgi:hypothetical protein
MPSRAGLRRLGSRYRRGGRRTPIWCRPLHALWGRTCMDVAALGGEPYGSSFSDLGRDRKRREVGASVRIYSCPF